MVFLYGQTPGKMACGVKIISIDESSVSFIKAVMRNIFGVILFPTFYFIQVSNILKGQLENRALGSYQNMFWLFGAMMIWVVSEFITMITNQKRQAIHDFIAGTVVIREPSSEKKWLLWLLIILFILNIIIPRLITDTNIVLKH